MASDMTNKTLLQAFNRKNGISDTESDEILELFLQKGAKPVQALLSQSIAAMNQDIFPEWMSRKPARPEIFYGKIADTADAAFDVIGIGGMFAYLNLLSYAFRHGGRHCIITNPNEIFTFAAWTLHPEEDMDQRLVPMFRTRWLAINELLRILRLSRSPEHLRYKAFKIDYAGGLRTLMNNPLEFVKLLKVNLLYILGEFTRAENRYAEINLERNRATLEALSAMGRIGEDPDYHILNLCGRIVFELPEEKALPMKRHFKKTYGLEGRRLSEPEVAELYGDRIGILEKVRNGRLHPVLYKGGHFWAGYKENALNAARSLGVEVFEEAAATRILIDPYAEKCAVSFRAGKREETKIAKMALLAAGGFGRDIIPVDGVSAMFAVQTERKTYRLFPTGIGEGGTIHMVPVNTLRVKKRNKTYFYHLGKATNGAAVGRNSKSPKRVHRDRDFITHLECSLKDILPDDGRLIWLTFTECGRPVVSGQGYRIDRFSPHQPICFEASGGCGLGGNTPIIPQVQTALKKRLKKNSGAI